MAFGPLAALFHEAVQGVAPDGELDGYAQTFPEDALLLDFMCGTGRVLVPWTARGGKMHGVDASSAMLARCEARLAAEGLATSLFRQDVSGLNLPFRYAGALVAGGALQYITDPAAAASALVRLRMHLVQPGLVVIDFHVPSRGEQNLAAPLVEVTTASLSDETRITLRSETTWTPDARLARSERRYSQRSGTHSLAEEHESVRSTWYEPAEATALLEAAGFVEVKALPSPGDHNDPAAFVVTAKANPVT